MTEKTGRNESCSCGSGKKAKFCCGGNGEGKLLTKPQQKKMLSPQGFQRCFLKLVKDSGDVVKISCQDLENLPKDEALAVKHDPQADEFIFAVIKIKRSPIIQPDKKVVLSRFN